MLRGYSHTEGLKKESAKTPAKQVGEPADQMKILYRWKNNHLTSARSKILPWNYQQLISAQKKKLTKFMECGMKSVLNSFLSNDYFENK